MICDGPGLLEQIVSLSMSYHYHSSQFYLHIFQTCHMCLYHELSILAVHTAMHLITYVAKCYF